MQKEISSVKQPPKNHIMPQALWPKKNRRYAWRQTKSFLKLIRINNLVILFITQYFTNFFVVNNRNWQAFLDQRFFLLAFSTGLIAAAGYVINDYYDVKIDIINKPGRVVIGRLMKRRIAMVCHLFLNFFGLVLGFLAGWKIGLLTFSCAFLLWLYSNQLKRQPFLGNFSVSLLTFLSIFSVAIFYGKAYEIVIAYGVFAFLISLVREIIKDMEDVKGDASFGCRTLPIIWGIRKTKLLLYFFTTLFCFLLFKACLLVWIQDKTTLFIYSLALIFVPAIALLVKLIKADTVKHFSQLSTLCKIIMITGVISMIFL
ncbi:MAG: geranylgeranylglycerol-phosphate geranylgeranyltransferase [Cytophagaceae bacterium]